MATTISTSLGTLIDDALRLLYRASERPGAVTIGSNALTSSSDTQLTLASGDSAEIGDILEFGLEAMNVTAKSADADPIYTVQRQYGGTPLGGTAGVINAGTVGVRNPSWLRYDVRNAVVRCVRNVMPIYLPYLTTEEYSVVTDMQYVALPADTMDVVRVGFMNTTIGRWIDFHNWEFVQDLPLAGINGVTTGKLLRVPGIIANGDTVFVTRVTQYPWSGGTTNPAESETVSLYVGSEDLPSLYAAAYVITGREVSRLEIERIEEWNQEAAIRQGVNLRMVQTAWQTYYRRLDESRRLVRIPRHRQYRPMRVL